MANPPYKYVLFDWDGTLLNSLPSWIAATRLALGKHNLGHLTDTVIARDIVNNLGRIHEQYPEVDSEVFRQQVLDDDHVINIHLSALHEGVEDTLKFLKKKHIPMGIVTTSDSDKLRNALSHHSLEQYFDILIAHQDVVNLKPHPEPVLKAIEKLKAVTGSTLYVGDSHHDTHAGRAAGVTTAIYYPTAGYYDQTFYDESGADYILRKLDEILVLCT